jgi:hypothetical protein
MPGIVSIVADPLTGSAGLPAMVYAPSQTPVTISATGAAATVAATIPAVAAKTNYLTGFEITAAGATAASVVSLSVTGLLGGTVTYTYAAVAGVTLGCVPLVVQFNPPLPASAVNTAIVVSLPSLGTGNTVANVVSHGFYQ